MRVSPSHSEALAAGRDMQGDGAGLLDTRKLSNFKFNKLTDGPDSLGTPYQQHNADAARRAAIIQGALWRIRTGTATASGRHWQHTAAAIHSAVAMAVPYAY